MSNLTRLIDHEVFAEARAAAGSFNALSSDPVAAGRDAEEIAERLTGLAQSAGLIGKVVVLSSRELIIPGRTIDPDSGVAHYRPELATAKNGEIPGVPGRFKGFMGATPILLQPTEASSAVIAAQSLLYKVDVGATSAGLTEGRKLAVAPVAHSRLNFEKDTLDSSLTVALRGLQSCGIRKAPRIAENIVARHSGADRYDPELLARTASDFRTLLRLNGRADDPQVYQQHIKNLARACLVITDYRQFSVMGQGGWLADRRRTQLLPRRPVNLSGRSMQGVGFWPAGPVLEHPRNQLPNTLALEVDEGLGYTLAIPLNTVTHLSPLEVAA